MKNIVYIYPQEKLDMLQNIIKIDNIKVSFNN